MGVTQGQRDRIFTIIIIVVMDIVPHQNTHSTVCTYFRITWQTVLSINHLLQGVVPLYVYLGLKIDV